MTAETLPAIFWKAYAVGWMVAAPIGPVNLEIIGRGLRHGPRHALAVGGGAVSVDVAYLLLFTLGLGLFLQGPGAQAVLTFGGGALLLYLGVQSLRQALAGFKAVAAEAPPEASPTLPASYVTGLGMTAANPMTIAFWSALSLQFVPLPVEHRLVAAGAVLLGCASWVCLLTAVLAGARPWLNPKVFAVVTALGGACLVAFGVRFILRAIGAAA